MIARGLSPKNRHTVIMAQALIEMGVRVISLALHGEVDVNARKQRTQSVLPIAQFFRRTLTEISFRNRIKRTIGVIQVL